MPYLDTCILSTLHETVSRHFLTPKFLKYVWPFFIIVNEWVKQGYNFNLYDVEILNRDSNTAVFM